MLKKTLIISIFIHLYVSTIFTRITDICTLNNPSAINYSLDGSLFAITDSAVNQLIFLDGKVSQINGQILVYPAKTCGVMRICRPLGIFNLLQPIETKFTPNNECLFVAIYGQVAGLQGAVYAYRIRPCSLDFSMAIPGVFAPTSLDISSNGLLAIGETAPENGKVLLYVIDGCSVKNASNPSIRNFFGTESIRVVFSPDGTTLAVSDISKSCVYLYKIENGSFAHAKPSKIPACRPHALAFSPDGKMLAIGEYRYKANLILAQVANGVLTGVTQTITHLNHISSVAFSSDGSQLAIGEFFNDRVLLFPTLDGAVIGRAKKIKFACNSGISAVAFSPRSSCLAVAQENGNRVSFLASYAP